MNFVIGLFTCLLVASLIFHQYTEAAFQDEYEDRNRVLLTYNLNTDQCHNISTDSRHATKEAANKACAMAFSALDNLGGNSCKGCRRLECRQLDGFADPQCSCLLSSTTFFDIRSNQPTAFRSCAWEFYVARVRGMSPNFKRRHQEILNDAVLKARRERRERALSRASTSRPPKRRRFGGNFSGTTSMKGGRVSRDLEISSFPNTSGSSASQIISEVELKDLHVCNLCGRGFSWAKSLVAHKKAHEKGARCESCELTFSTVQTYKKHNKKNHPEVYAAQIAEENLAKMKKKPHECETCGARFASKGTWSQHKAIHRGETTCDQCNKVFPRITMLNTHKKKEHS